MDTQSFPEIFLKAWDNVTEEEKTSGLEGQDGNGKYDKTIQVAKKNQEIPERKFSPISGG